MAAKKSSTTRISADAAQAEIAKLAADQVREAKSDRGELTGRRKDLGTGRAPSTDFRRKRIDREVAKVVASQFSRTRSNPAAEDSDLSSGDAISATMGRRLSAAIRKKCTEATQNAFPAVQIADMGAALQRFISSQGGMAKEHDPEGWKVLKKVLFAVEAAEAYVLQDPRFRRGSEIANAASELEGSGHPRSWLSRFLEQLFVPGTSVWGLQWDEPTCDDRPAKLLRQIAEAPAFSTIGTKEVRGLRARLGRHIPLSLVVPHENGRSKRIMIVTFDELRDALVATGIEPLPASFESKAAADRWLRDLKKAYKDEWDKAQQAFLDERFRARKV